MYKKVLITGSQRSGTTIASHIIAHDLHYQYIDERDFYVRDKPTFESFLADDNPMVIQCPAMSSCIHEYSNDDILIAWMIRPIEEIIASGERIGWGQLKERNSYKVQNDDRHIAVIALEYWQRQKTVIKHWLELDYHSLRGHELWVDRRDEFGARQWWE